MKTKLITALRLTATALEQNTFNYEWTKQNQCNCGALVCALTGMTATELSKKTRWGSKANNKGGYTWAERAGLVCPIAGKPTDELFSILCDHGLTTKDIVDLEQLRNERVIDRIKWKPIVKMIGKWWWKKKVAIPQKPTLRYNNPHHVALYMRAWADLLTEEGKDDVVTTQPEAPVETLNVKERMT